MEPHPSSVWKLTHINGRLCFYLENIQTKFSKSKVLSDFEVPSMIVDWFDYPVVDKLGSDLVLDKGAFSTPTTDPTPQSQYGKYVLMLKGEDAKALYFRLSTQPKTTLDSQMKQMENVFCYRKTNGLDRTENYFCIFSFPNNNQSVQGRFRIEYDNTESSNVPVPKLGSDRAYKVLSHQSQQSYYGKHLVLKKEQHQAELTLFGGDARALFEHLKDKVGIEVFLQTEYIETTMVNCRHQKGDRSYECCFRFSLKPSAIGVE